jgi:hypothetical protein
MANCSLCAVFSWTKLLIDFVRGKSFKCQWVEDIPGGMKNPQSGAGRSKLCGHYPKRTKLAAFVLRGNSSLHIT